MNRKLLYLCSNFAFGLYICDNESKSTYTWKLYVNFVIIVHMYFKIQDQYFAEFSTIKNTKACNESHFFSCNCTMMKNIFFKIPSNVATTLIQKLIALQFSIINIFKRIIRYAKYWSILKLLKCKINIKKSWR